MAESVTLLRGIIKSPVAVQRHAVYPAGHYVPAVSDHIFQVNKKLAPDSKIPLKGFAVGNGLTDPAIQYDAYGEDSPLLAPLPSHYVICLLTVCFRPSGDFAVANKLISPATRSSMARVYPLCRIGVQLCNSINFGFICELALAVCQNTQFAPVIILNPEINVSHDAAQRCQAVTARQRRTKFCALYVGVRHQEEV